MKTYSKADLAKFNVSNLTKIAVEEFSLTVAEGATKAQISKMILDKQAGIEPPAPKAEPAKDEKTKPAAEAKKEDKKVTGEEIDISEVQEGDVIHYLSSKKVYLVASISTRGEKIARRLFSATQQYYSTKINFKVIRVIKSEGKLTDKIAKQFDELVKTELVSKKNTEFTKLYNAVKTEIEAIAKTEALKAEAKKKAKAEAAKTETEQPQTPEAVTSADLQEGALA